MARFLRALAVLLTAASAVTPIQKVLQMLESMKSKGIAEKKEEEVRFTAFSRWCSDVNASRVRAIDAGGQRAETLEADVAQAQADVEALEGKIAELGSSIGAWEKEMASAEQARQKEHADYIGTHDEYAATVDALERSIQTLKNQPRNVPQSLFQAGSALQRIAAAGGASNTRAVRQAVQALSLEASERGAVKQEQDPLDVKAPQAYAYESQSAGVLQMLADLHDRFVGERTDLEREEMLAMQAHELLMQRLNEEVRRSKGEQDSKSERSAARAEDKAAAEGELKEVLRAKKEDEAYLTDLTGLCAQKADDFDQRQDLRAKEIDALSQAIEIISSEAVTTGKEYLPGDLTAQGKSLAQLHSRATPRSQQLQRVASLLGIRAAALGSQLLAEAARKANDDPFAKVKKMIQDLLYRLMEEANQEADHHAWCTAELATNEKTRSIKTKEVEELTTEVERLKAAIAKFAQDIADLSESISAIEAELAEAVKERQEEKEKNAQTVKEAQEAEAAVSQALAVLREFYAQAGDATALAQQAQTPAEDAPITFDSPYQGMQGAAGGVLGMLEVIQSDFARLRVSTENSEVAADKEFRNFKAESEQDKALKEAEVEHKSSNRQSAEHQLKSTKRAVEQTQSELDAALSYFEKLKPSCVELGTSYEERVKRRQAELQSLQEAYKILDGNEVSM